MSLWILFQQWAVRNFTQLNGRNLLITLLGYSVISWLLLTFAGEDDLTRSFTDFVYYLFVTASTVGYGDMSPTTTMGGKWVASLFVIPPGGLDYLPWGGSGVSPASLFTIGKAVCWENGVSK